MASDTTLMPSPGKVLLTYSAHLLSTPGTGAMPAHTATVHLLKD